MDQYERAIYLYNDVIELLLYKNDKASQRKVISSYKKLGIAFGKLNMHKEAIENYKRGLEEMINDPTLCEDLKGLIFFYDQLASIYMSNKMWQEATLCYTQSLKLKIEYYGLEREQTANGFLLLA
jgi:tetratricopeptide (TPR) repeat protein